MACQNPLSLSYILPSPSKPHHPVLSLPPLLLSRSRIFSFHPISSKCSLSSLHHRSFPRRRQSVRISSPRFLCKAAEYVFPDPIPEFAEAETSKFRAHLLERLAKKDVFGNSLEEIVQICTEILSNFLHTEYGGPGTLLVVPFIDMADTINERGLPGGPQAARAAVVWAQNYIDKDWKDWTGDPNL